MNRLSMKIAFVLTSALLAGPFIVLANAQSADKVNPVAAADDETAGVTARPALLPVATAKPTDLLNGMWKTAPGSKAISTTSYYTGTQGAPVVLPLTSSQPGPSE